MTSLRARIKVCGLTRAADVRLVAALGAAYAGFVFWPGSPRAVTPEQAARLTPLLPSGTLPVGVFVNAAPEEVARVAKSAGLAIVQLHGDEPPETVERTRALSGLPAIKAIRVATGSDLAAAEAHAAVADWRLYDTRCPGKPGGTGEAFDWSLLAGCELGRAFLAGGLTPGNAPAAAALRPFALDVASGVEARPGIKDAEKLTAFFAAVAGPAEA